MPDFTELVGVFGPSMALIIYMVMNRPKDAAKEDPVAKLVEELSALNKQIADLRSEIAGLDGFIRGRMK